MTDASRGLAASDIDRIAPTVRPDRRAVMRQNWNHLLFLHWVLPVAQIRPLVPPGLELDLYEGQAHVGLVPFTMTGVRPLWSPPVPLVSDFHETNVRTYVHFEGRDPGVWFFSLDAAQALAVVLARSFFHLPYHRAKMRLTVAPGPDNTLSYQSQRSWPAPLPATCAVKGKPTGPVAPARIGTLEYFLAERYLLYAAHHDHLYQGQVHHSPYPLQTAEILELDETLLAAAGLTRPNTPPIAHYVRCVRAEIFPIQRIK